MPFFKSLLNLLLGLTGGIGANLIAAWIQQDIWNNIFAPLRLCITFVGVTITLLVLAWLDSTIQRSQSSKSGIHSNIQIGNALIRVLRGTNVYRNVQIGSSKIIVIDSINSQNDGNIK